MQLRKKSLEKFRLAWIRARALSSAIPVQRSNQPTGRWALKFFIPQFISLPGLL